MLGSVPNPLIKISSVEVSATCETKLRENREGSPDGERERQWVQRMPELPEVEVARRAIEEHCVGKKITGCSVADDPKVIDGFSRADFESALVGRSIVAALRKGKNLWLRLDSPPFPTFHFGRYTLPSSLKSPLFNCLRKFLDPSSWVLGMAGAVYIKGVALTKYRRLSLFLIQMILYK